MIRAILKNENFLIAGIILILSILSAYVLLTFTLLYIYIIPAIAIGALIIAILFRNPVYFIYLYFLSFTLFLEDAPGIQLTDVIFFCLTILFVVLYFFPYIVSGRAEVTTNIDKWYVLFIICLGFGFINGLLVSKSRIFAVSDMTYFIGVWLYFPFKYHFKSEKFRKTIFAILLIMCFYVLIRNFVNYREIIIQSNLPWQIQVARVPENEIIILTGTVLTLLAFAYHPNKLFKPFFFFLFSLFAAGLILTQSRGYWVTFVIVVLIIIAIGDRSAKLYVLFGTLFLSLIGILVVYFFFGHIFDLVVKAITHRFESIDTISSPTRMGPSLLERVYETETIVGKLLHNPIAGYGMGTRYERYYILFGTYRSMTYIHNGYLAIWFKTGIVGLVAIVAFCLATLKNLWRIFHSVNTYFMKLISLAAFSLLSGMLVVNVTSPQFLGFDSMTLIILMGIFASYYAHEQRSPQTKTNKLIT